MRQFPQQKNKIRRRFSRVGKILTPILVLIVLALGIYLVFYKIKLFNIKNIEVVGTKSFVNEHDVRELVKGQSYEKNILSYKHGDLENFLVQTFQGAKHIEVKKEYPSTLKVIVEERVPIALVYSPKSPDYFIVDDAGYVLGLVNPENNNLPKILYNGEISVGYFLDSEVVSVYFDLLYALDAENLQVSSVSVYDRYLMLYLRDSVEVFVDKIKSKSETAKILKALLEKTKIEGKSIKTVDLRYEKVIVSYR